jgi:Predicted membrane protein (DUF2306)
MPTATMTSGAARPGPAKRLVTANAALSGSAALWFVAATLGQLAFVYFIAGFYGGPTLRGTFEAWNRKDLITGYVAGDRAGNLYFAAHVLMAGLITSGGLLQLVPSIRARAPSLHRWNGRLYILTAFLMALGGLWLVWLRHTYLTVAGAIGISLDALLIMGFAVASIRSARARQIGAHRCWALRLFVAANGVWFQRVGYLAWIILNRGPVGIGKRMDGPFDIFWGFGCFLVPLAALELYLFAKAHAGPRGKVAMAAGLFVMTAIMSVGIVGAYVAMWRPFL